MATRKVTVTLPEELISQAREELESGEADSMSAIVAQALERRFRSDRLDAVLRELRAKLGPPTEEDRAWVAKVLGR